MNSFTNPEPSFPYESADARRVLGIPNKPAIHLAITDLAEGLLSIAKLSSLDSKTQRIAALRAASGAVLYGWTLSATERELRSVLQLVDASEEHAPHRIVNGKNWLAEAKDRLRQEGSIVQNDVASQSTNYGGRDLDDK